MTGLVFDKAQTEGLEVHPEPRRLTPSLKAGLRAAERVKRLSLPVGVAYTKCENECRTKIIDFQTKERIT